MDNISFVRSLQVMIDDRINRSVVTYKNQAAKVVAVDGNLIDVESLTLQDGIQLNYFKVPVLESPMFHIPVRVGDIGLLLFINTSLLSRIQNESTATAEDTSENFCPVFMPLSSNKNIEEVTGDIVIKSPDELSSIILSDEGKMVYKNETSTITVDDGVIELDNGSSIIEMNGSKVTINGALEVS